MQRVARQFRPRLQRNLRFPFAVVRLARLDVHRLGAFLASPVHRHVTAQMQFAGLRIVIRAFGRPSSLVVLERRGPVG